MSVTLFVAGMMKEKKVWGRFVMTAPLYKTRALKRVF